MPGIIIGGEKKKTMTEDEKSSIVDKWQVIFDIMEKEHKFRDFEALICFCLGQEHVCRKFNVYSTKELIFGTFMILPMVFLFGNINSFPMLISFIVITLALFYSFSKTDYIGLDWIKDNKIEFLERVVNKKEKSLNLSYWQEQLKKYK